MLQPIVKPAKPDKDQFGLDKFGSTFLDERNEGDPWQPTDPAQLRVPWSRVASGSA
jgi:hypothetical protein